MKHLLPFMLSLGSNTNTNTNTNAVPPFVPSTEIAVEVTIETRLAPPKGLGVFALEPIANGTVVCRYQGDLLTLDEQETRYPDSFPDYCLHLSPELSIDAERSDHWSRFINHHELPNLRVHKRIEPEPCAWFEAARDIAVGEELSFDYGPGFFAARGIQPAPGTESREVSFYTTKEDGIGEEIARRAENDRAWEAAGLPEVPLTTNQIEAIVSCSSVSDEAKKTALVRALDYFGAVEWIDDDVFALGIGSRAEGETQRNEINRSSVELNELAASLGEVIRIVSAKA